MSLLCIEEPNIDGAWRLLDLSGSASHSVSTNATSDQSVDIARIDRSAIPMLMLDPNSVLLQRVNHPSIDRAVLVPKGASCSVNGEQIETGIKCLTHKDEIVINDKRIYFSGERIASIAIFNFSEPRRCKRCTKDIVEGDPFCVCPNCGTYVHENVSSGRNCWTMAPGCPVCQFSTDLAADFTFPPEGF